MMKKFDDFSRMAFLASKQMREMLHLETKADSFDQYQLCQRNKELFFT